MKGTKQYQNAKSRRRSRKESSRKSFLDLKKWQSWYNKRIKKGK
jgi:hypothetical protein